MLVRMRLRGGRVASLMDWGDEVLGVVGLYLSYSRRNRGFTNSVPTVTTDLVGFNVS